MTLEERVRRIIEVNPGASDLDIEAALNFVPKRKTVQTFASKCRREMGIVRLANHGGGGSDKFQRLTPKQARAAWLRMKIRELKAELKALETE